MRADALSGAPAPPLAPQLPTERSITRRRARHLSPPEEEEEGAQRLDVEDFFPRPFDCDFADLCNTLLRLQAMLFITSYALFFLLASMHPN